MKNSFVLKSVLFLSGLVAVLIGGFIVVAPEAFYAVYGIQFDGDVSLLNEVRATGGALLAIGGLITAGAFVTRLTFTSAVVAPVLYLSYGLSRVLSVTVDGMPVGELTQAAVAEIVIGLVCVVVLLKYRQRQGRIA
jgi:hypothetical protein